MNFEEMDRTHYIISRRYPGYTKEVHDAIKEARSNIKTYKNPLERIQEISQNWTLLGCSIPKPASTGDAILDEQSRLERLNAWILEVDLYEGELAALTDDEFFAFYAKIWKLEDEKVRRTLKENDSSRFFNEPDAQADYNYWQNFPFWSVDEATSLFLGKDPRVVNAKSLKRAKLSSKNSAFVGSLQLLRETIKRCEASGVLPSPITKEYFISWAQGSGIEASTPFVKWASDFTAPRTRKVSTDRLDGNERHGLYKVILGMAVFNYGYVIPKTFTPEHRSGIYGKIATNAYEAGLRSLDDKTVRKHLKAAAQWAIDNELKLRQPSKKD